MLLTQQSVARTGTSHHRADRRFLDMFADDFGIRAFYAYALEGVPKKQALAVCFWAERKSLDGEERGEMIQAYCRKHGVGRYDRRLVDAPPATYDGSASRGA